MSTHKLTHSGNILLIGFGGMLVMMSVLVYLAMKQDVSMVSKNYYEQELVYQQKLDAISNTGLYDSGFTITTKGDVLLLQVPPALSRALNEGSIHFYCPSNDKMDYREALSANESGLYRINKTMLKGNGYVVKITLNTGGKDYYKELKID